MILTPLMIQDMWMQASLQEAATFAELVCNAHVFKTGKVLKWICY
jgi:hypothetical protein